ncbi:hypothetical protein KHS38_03790 [Mucilaginibacter sp. Bleaf8]|uniref:hypothetical protein n=1 Tax=Mucilaginibacter sp. Bleaf8 TaxID=2834430 RepID=UPI001BCE3020|nr:hypothetical protein [Mucilaginibacter sp. Bleaf8]MBS7563518.1 hypothetical protein [Mucilaginibacter sp. Bleaf8]
MKSIITTPETPMMGNVTEVASLHMVSKTPAGDSVSPYPISRQDYKVVYKKDANGYWSFVQCDCIEVN